VHSVQLSGPSDENGVAAKANDGICKKEICFLSGSQNQREPVRNIMVNGNPLATVSSLPQMRDNAGTWYDVGDELHYQLSLADCKREHCSEPQHWC
jgi:hypothetical protein